MLQQLVDNMHPNAIALVLVPALLSERCLLPTHKYGGP